MKQNCLKAGLIGVMLSGALAAQAKWVDVYKCGFEADEDLSKWSIENAEKVPSKYLSEVYGSKVDATDAFHFEEFEVYSGERSLSLGEHGTSLKLPKAASRRMYYSCAYFNADFPKGKYTISGMIKMGENPVVPQLFVVFADDIYDAEQVDDSKAYLMGLDEGVIPSGTSKYRIGEWIPFSFILETEKPIRYILFEVAWNDNGGYAIDDLLIQRAEEGTETPDPGEEGDDAVKTAKADKNEEVEVVDLTGREVYQGAWKDFEGKGVFVVKHSAGTYKVVR